MTQQTHSFTIIMDLVVNGVVDHKYRDYIALPGLTSAAFFTELTGCVKRVVGTHGMELANMKADDQNPISLSANLTIDHHINAIIKYDLKIHRHRNVVSLVAVENSRLVFGISDVAKDLPKELDTRGLTNIVFDSFELPAAVETTVAETNTQGGNTMTKPLAPANKLSENQMIEKLREHGFVKLLRELPLEKAYDQMVAALEMEAAAQQVSAAQEPVPVPAPVQQVPDEVVAAQNGKLYTEKEFEEKMNEVLRKLAAQQQAAPQPVVEPQPVPEQKPETQIIAGVEIRRPQTPTAIAFSRTVVADGIRTGGNGMATLLEVTGDILQSSFYGAAGATRWAANGLANLVEPSAPKTTQPIDA